MAEGEAATDYWLLWQRFRNSRNRSADCLLPYPRFVIGSPFDNTGSLMEEGVAEWESALLRGRSFDTPFLAGLDLGSASAVRLEYNVCSN
jgi:hypothetical protein